jgi:hypothetical protein
VTLVQAQARVTHILYRYFVHRPDKPRSSQFPSLVGALRLSAKYFAQDLRERCLERLASDWPTTLRGWDARETEAIDGKGAYVPREYTTHPILLIELAKELGLIEFLPSAFYDLSRYGPSKIFLGTPALKGVLSQSADTGTDAPEIKSPQDDDPLQPVRLTNDMLARTLRGRERGQKFIHKFIITRILHRAASEDCLYRLEPTNGVASFPCYQSFYFIALNVLRAVGGIASGRDADPLFTLLQAVEMLSRMDFENGNEGDGGKCGLKMCGTCKADFEEDCHRARRAVWRELPRWFGLEDAIDGQWGKE